MTAPLSRGTRALHVLRLTMAFGFGVALGPLLSGVLIAWGFDVPFGFGAFLAAVGVLVVLTQIEAVITPPRSLPFLGDVP